MGHGMQVGDRIITGNIAQVPIRAGDTVTGHIDGLGSVSLLAGPAKPPLHQQAGPR